MSKKLDSLTPQLTEFIGQQKMFFVGTAAADGRVNISPKGMDSLRVISPNNVIWINFTGSGNETAGHIRLKNRMTIMFCAFNGNPLILRLYGSANVFHERDAEFHQLVKKFTAVEGARQIFEMDIEMVQTSCGFAVPLMEYTQDRSILRDWATKQGEEGIRTYWEKNNQTTIDGFETNIFSD